MASTAETTTDVSEFIFETQAQLATFFRRSERTIGRWIKRGCPGEPGNYNLREAVIWYQENIVQDRDPKAEAIKADLKRSKARIARTKADFEAVKFQEHQGILVHRDKVRPGLFKFANIIRGCGETLQQQFGEDALRIFNDAIDQAEKETIAELFGDD